MAEFSIGEMIKGLRLRAGLSQEELAFPILERSHLSKIERGVTVPSKETLKLLFERLGHNPTFIADFLIDEEAAKIDKIKETMAEIKNRVQNEVRYVDPAKVTKDDIPGILKKAGNDEAEELMASLESNERFMSNPLNRQWLLRIKAENLFERLEYGEEALNLTMEAIKITMPAYKDEDIKKYFLGRQDVQLLSNLAGICFENGDSDRAINILYGVKENFENRRIDIKTWSDSFGMIFNNLVIFLSLVHRYEEGIKVCDEGIALCLAAQTFVHLPTIVYMKGHCIISGSGDKEAYGQLMKQVYHASEMFQQYGLQDMAKDGAKEHLGIDL